MLDILVAEDEPSLRGHIATPLAEAGYRVTEAADGAEAMLLIRNRVFDVAICDVRMPKVDGLTLFRQLQETSPQTVVILMTAYANVPDAVAALQAGAHDYVAKPFDVDLFATRIIGRIAERRQLEEELRQARAQLNDATFPAIVGRSPAMTRLHTLIDTLALSDAPVLITGESGTGKELIARTLHRRSARGTGPFIAVNCAALPENLIEAELFGHERGAFTGAVRKRDGRFKLAEGGTVLLDEVGEMPPAAQIKLLRVLQEGTIEPLGTSSAERVDVRVMSATHRNLRQLVAEGRFREDLYYRLNVLDIEVPPLRDRAGDLLLLCEHFMRKLAPVGRPPPPISPAAWALLAAYPYPGNVREFAHALERAVVMAQGRAIDVEHLPSTIAGAVAPQPPAAEAAGGEPVEFQPLAAAAREFERAHLIRALAMAQGKRGRAAELLGISRKNLWEKLRLHAVGDGDGEPEGSE